MCIVSFDGDIATYLYSYRIEHFPKEIKKFIEKKILEQTFIE